MSLIKWIKCSDKVPDDDRDVLICHEITNGRVIDIAFWTGERWLSPIDGWGAWSPTHWAECESPDDSEDTAASYEYSESQLNHFAMNMCLCQRVINGNDTDIDETVTEWNKGDISLYSTVVKAERLREHCKYVMSDCGATDCPVYQERQLDRIAEMIKTHLSAEYKVENSTGGDDNYA